MASNPLGQSTNKSVMGFLDGGLTRRCTWHVPCVASELSWFLLEHGRWDGRDVVWDDARG
jgi:hypothetical protein